MSTFIVRLQESASDSELKSAIDSFKQHGGTVTREHSLFKGFTGSIPDDKVNVLESLPAVEAVEKDQPVHIN